MSVRKDRRWVIYAIVLGAFFLSVGYSWYFRVNPVVDAQAYDRIAWNIVQGYGYREDASQSFETDTAILRVGPGYQFFLATLYFLFGHRIAAVWLSQAILLALTAGIVYLIARRIFRESAEAASIGFIAALFIAFSPDLITLSGMVMTETLGVFLVAFSAYLFLCYMDSADAGTGQVRTGGLMVATAAVFTYAVMVRTPAALLFLAFLAMWVWKKRWGDIVVFIAVGLLLFTPWTIRNYAIYDAIIPTQTVFGHDLLAGNHPGASGEFEIYSVNERLIAEHGRVEGNAIALREALVFIVANPVEFAILIAKRISIYFSFVRPTGFWFHLEGWSRMLTLAFSALYSVLLFICGFWGILRASRLAPQSQDRIRFLFLMLLSMPLAVIGIIVETRYRFLSYPFFAVFAGAGIRYGFPKNERRTLAAVIGLLVANAGIDAARNTARIMERIREIAL